MELCELRRSLRDTRILVEEQLHLHTFPTHFLLILKDLIKFRLGTSQPQPPKQHTKENNHKHFLKVKFHNKGVEMINLSGILHSRRVKDTIPVLFEHNEPPTVSYKYTKTIGPSVFNFKKVTESINLSSNDCTTYKCSSSAFLYQPLGHVVTGDLSIITNRKLRHLIKKGPNFREQNNINWDLCLKLCMEGVHKSHKKVCQTQTSTCRDEILKNQPNKTGTTPQYFYTIPTSCAILPKLCVCICFLVVCRRGLSCRWKGVAWVCCA